MRGSPDFMQNLFMRQHLSAIDHEVAQQIIFLGRERDQLVGQKHLMLDQIHPQKAVGQLRLARLLNRGGAQGRVDARLQDIHIERLGHIIRRAEVQGLHDVFIGRARRQNDDRHLRPFAQGRNNPRAVHVRQVEVEQDNIGFERDAETDGLFAFIAPFDREPLFGEYDLQHLLRLGFVVDHQNSVFLFAQAALPFLRE